MTRFGTYRRILPFPAPTFTAPREKLSGFRFRPGNAEARRTLIIPAEQARGQALTELARKRFDNDLRPIEQQVLLHSCAYDDPASWAAPEQGRTPTGRPLPGWLGGELRPALVRWLLTDLEAFALLEPRGLRVWNARLLRPLDLTGCRVAVRLELRFCLVEAPIILAMADLPGLAIRNSTLLQSIHAPNLKVRGPLLFEDASFAELVRLDAATIEGGVRMSSVTFVAKTGALSLQGAAIANDLQLRPDFQAAGALMLRGLRVGGQLSLSGAKLTAKGVALHLDDGKIGWHVFLRDGFTSTGEVRLAAAEVGGQLDASGANLTAEGTSLCLDQAKIRGNVLLRDGFVAAGAMQLRRAQIGGNLDFEAASVRSVDAEGMELKGDLLWRQLVSPEHAALTLAGAKVKRLYEDRVSWPRPGKLRLNGLLLDDMGMLEGASADTASLIYWLGLQPAAELGEPQPWTQAAALLAAKGQRRAARHVLFCLRKHQSRNRWAHSHWKFIGRAWDQTFSLVVERPLRVVYPVALILSFGAAMLYRGDIHPAAAAGFSERAVEASRQRVASAPSLVTTPEPPPASTLHETTPEEALPTPFPKSSKPSAQKPVQPNSKRAPLR